MNVELTGAHAASTVPLISVIAVPASVHGGTRRAGSAWGMQIQMFPKELEISGPARSPAGCDNVCHHVLHWTALTSGHPPGGYPCCGLRAAKRVHTQTRTATTAYAVVIVGRLTTRLACPASRLGTAEPVYEMA
jgi:hypothetical protein